MRSIETQADREGREKRRAKIIGIAILLIMVFSTVGYSFLSNPSTSGTNPDNQNTTNDGGKVHAIGNQWGAFVNGQNILFSSSPTSIKNISVDVNFSLSDYQGSTLYIAGDNQAIFYEIESTLGKYADRVQEACYGNCSLNLPEKNCSDNLIVWRDSEENRVYQEEKCVFIEGNMRGVDAFLYKVFDLNIDDS